MYMKQIIIEGNKRLSGTIKIGGAKNSVVALIPASILAGDIVKITNGRLLDKISDEKRNELLSEEVKDYLMLKLMLIMGKY